MDIPCFECNLPSMGNHHVVPRVYGGLKTVPLCEKCHGLVHSRKFTHHRFLIKRGLENAKAEGVVLGAPVKVTSEKMAQIKELRKKGHSIKTIARSVQLSVGSVHRVLSETKV